MKKMIGYLLVAAVPFLITSCTSKEAKNKADNTKTVVQLEQPKSKQPEGVKDTMEFTQIVKGLEYHKLQDGSGEKPKKGQKVKIHYTGWLSSKSKNEPFDSSVKRGMPFETHIGVGRLIQGWDLGVPTMKVGEKGIFKIAPELGYGSRGAGASIPPNAELMFEVELLEIIG